MFVESIYLPMCNIFYQHEKYFFFFQSKPDQSGKEIPHGETGINISHNFEFMISIS